MTFHLENPKALYALLVLIPAIIIAIFQYTRFKLAITSFKHIAKAKVVRRLILRMIFFSLAFISIIFALADPYWGIQPISVQTSGTAVSYVFDISYSMNAKDAGVNHDVSRLDSASLYAKALTEKLAGSGISVILAKGDGFVAVPLTEDLYAVENLLDNLSPNLVSNPGTNLEKGIQTAIQSFPPQSSRQSTIILFTDGDETAGNLEQAIYDASTYGIKVIILGFGSEQGAQIVSGDEKTTVYTTLKSRELKSTIENIIEKNKRTTYNTIKYISAIESGSLAKVLDIINPTQDVNNLGITYEMQPIPRYKLFILFALIFVILGIFAAELNIKMPKSIQNALCIFAVISILTGCSADLSSRQTILYSTLKWYQKDYQDSTVGFLKVIEDAENNQNQEVLQYGLFGLASSYIMQDEETSALEKLEQIDLDAPDPIRFATYYNIGIIAHKHGEYEKATEAFKQALLIDNTNIDAKINLELSLMENSTHSKAGSQELKPVSESDYQSSIEDTLFSVIRESEQNRWKNTQTQNQQSDILDY